MKISCISEKETTSPLETGSMYKIKVSDDCQELCNSLEQLIDILKERGKKLDYDYFREAREGVITYSKEASKTYCFIEEVAFNFANEMISDDPSVRNNLQLIDLMRCLNKWIKVTPISKDGVIDMDRKAIEDIRNMLVQALSGDDLTLRRTIEETIPLLNEGVYEQTTAKSGSWAKRVSTQQSSAMYGVEKSTLTLPDPETDTYERWANRTDKSEKPLDFLHCVWGEYIDAGVMYQSDLRGSTTKKPLDKRLFDLCSQQCKDENKNLNDYLPNKSKQVDNEIAETNFSEFNNLARLKRTIQKRQKFANKRLDIS